ncbi:MAG: NUDIX domain-containing protein [Planctomycetota bacterium]|jgi:rfaE bifunctional protein nucleotidyltransferase chain/domain|nr:NUDIX domain-containing protein [Planctomycetota bacterium]
MIKLRTLDELTKECRDWRAEGKRIVWTNGCFDLFHAGHVRALEAARSLGDMLVVGLNSDRSVRELKGEGRPLCSEADRIAVLSGLETVTRVAVFDNVRCDRELALVRPHIWTKSGDYSPDSLDSAERAAVLAGGGEIVLTPLIEGISTTLLIKRIRRRNPENIVSASCAFVRDPGGRLLMVATRYADGIKWGLPGGGHRRGEALPDTARRETLEETGIGISIARYMGVIERMEPSLGMHLSLHVFEAAPFDASAFQAEDFPPRPGEFIAGGAWFTPERLRTEKGIVLGRRLWLEYGGNPECWPPYLFLRPGEE